MARGETTITSTTTMAMPRKATMAVHVVPAWRSKTCSIRSPGREAAAAPDTRVPVLEGMPVAVQVSVLSSLLSTPADRRRHHPPMAVRGRPQCLPGRPEPRSVASSGPPIPMKRCISFGTIELIWGMTGKTSTMRITHSFLTVHAKGLEGSSASITGTAKNLESQRSGIGTEVLRR